MKPCEQAFDLPSPTVASEYPTILCCWPLTVPPVRCNQFYATLAQQSGVERVAVVRSVTDQSVGGVLEEGGIDGLINQGHFMWRSALNANRDWKTMSVRNGHDLGPLPAFRLTNRKTPFFAELNVPSMKASWMSMPPRSRRSSASACSARSIVPSRTHCWNLRWQVWYDGYSRGRSLQRAPVFKIQRTPLRTSRAGTGGRPTRPARVSSSNSGAMSCHCFSDSFILTLDHISRSVSIPERK